MQSDKVDAANFVMRTGSLAVVEINNDPAANRSSQEKSPNLDGELRLSCSNLSQNP
jgi:hypothetical protein